MRYSAVKRVFKNELVLYACGLYKISMVRDIHHIRVCDASSDNAYAMRVGTQLRYYPQ